MLCDNSSQLEAVNYYQNALHLGCCSSPRSASGSVQVGYSVTCILNGFIFSIIWLIILWLIFKLSLRLLKHLFYCTNNEAAVNIVSLSLLLLSPKFLTTSFESVFSGWNDFSTWSIKVTWNITNSKCFFSVNKWIHRPLILQ